jgi:hypothetical protein
LPRTNTEKEGEIRAGSVSAFEVKRSICHGRTR